MRHAVHGKNSGKRDADPALWIPHEAWPSLTIGRVHSLPVNSLPCKLFNISKNRSGILVAIIDNNTAEGNLITLLELFPSLPRSLAPVFLWNADREKRNRTKVGVTDQVAKSEMAFVFGLESSRRER